MTEGTVLTPYRASAKAGGGPLPPELVKNIWQPGKSGNPSGFSGKYGEVRRMCRDFSPEGTQAMIEIVRDRTEDTRCRIVAFQEINNRAWGKPREYDPREEAAPGLAFDPSKIAPEKLEEIKRALMALLAASMPAEDAPVSE